MMCPLRIDFFVRHAVSREQKALKLPTLVSNLCYAAISLLLCASPKNPVAVDARNNNHTDETFTRKWACWFGVCKRDTPAVYCIRQAYSLGESVLNFSANLSNYNGTTA